MRQALVATAWAVSLFASLAVGSSQAADLIWEVENPFRFFKPTRSFACTRPRSTRCAAMRRRRCRPTSSGAPSAASTIPTARMPRTRTSARRPPASAMSKAGSAGRRRPSARPATTATAVRGATRRCASANIRGARAKEDYVLPEAHTVAIRIAPEQLAGVAGDCTWSWQPRKAGGKVGIEAPALQGQADHRARPVFARPRELRASR